MCFCSMCFSGLLFYIEFHIWGLFLEAFWEAFGEPGALGNHAKVHNYMQLQGLHPFGAESVSGSAFGRGLGCIFLRSGCQLGHPLGLHVATSASFFRV